VFIFERDAAFASQSWRRNFGFADGRAPTPALRALGATRSSLGTRENEWRGRETVSQGEGSARLPRRAGRGRCLEIDGRPRVRRVRPPGMEGLSI